MTLVLRPARPASYQDVLNAPVDQTAELLHGELSLQARLSKPQQEALGRLARRLGARSDGGWVFLAEARLHLGDDVLVADLAGWRTTRMLAVPDADRIEQVPDWVCEVSTPFTGAYDRLVKAERYLHHGVSHLWLADTHRETLEAFGTTDDGGVYRAVGAYEGQAVVCAPPFSEVEFLLTDLWPVQPVKDPR